MLFDWLVTGQVVPANPAWSVRGPKHVVRRGKTPVLSAAEARTLLDSIDVSALAGLRDRAVIGLMVYSFARVSAAVGMDVMDYFQQGKRWWLRLREKGGKHHDVPAHHNAEAYLDAYLDAAGIAGDRHGPLFRTVDRHGLLTARRLTRNDALRMVKRRARDAGLPGIVCCHTFRATGITAYLANGGTIENAQAIAAHESPRTTKLYDRTGDEISLDEVERIQI
jgi:integrase